MHVKLLNHKLIASILMLFALIPEEASASNQQCFPSLTSYLKTTYGNDYEKDENIVVNEKQYGKARFKVVEDTTSGTNHSFIVLKESSNQACVLLATGPIVSLEAAKYDKAGFPVTLISTDQASPGSPSHELSYAFDAKKNRYSVDSCREIQYKENKRYEKKIDCKNLMNY